ncbi:unnamed protein product [Prunus armeniaca]|uniref:RRM domain-containing protein n=1 Tax=Prunus armeniaca TaxID=36596 RepID=A0A6J5U6V5_PRUAR|nr:unnamed protein product [Prunus armeniaca]
MVSSSNSNSGTHVQFGDTSHTKIFVGGLPWETQRDTMKSYFEQFGEILEAVVITDKITARSKGYGFVTFKDPEAAGRACENPNPIIDGRRANCNLAVLGAQKNHSATPQPQPHERGGLLNEAEEGMKKSRASSRPVIDTTSTYFYFHQHNPQYAFPYYSAYGYPVYQQDNFATMQSYNYNGYGGGGGGGGRGQHHYYSNSSNAAGGPGVYHPFYFYSPSPMMILVQQQQQQQPQQWDPTTSNAKLEPTASSHTLTVTGKQQQHPLRQDPTRRRN